MSLEEIINQVIVKNKEFLIGRRIKIKKENLEKTVVTDSKWMEFIINQILNNSIKYSKIIRLFLFIQWKMTNR